MFFSMLRNLSYKPLGSYRYSKKFSCISNKFKNIDIDNKIKRIVVNYELVGDSSRNKIINNNFTKFKFCKKLSELDGIAYAFNFIYLAVTLPFLFLAFCIIIIEISCEYKNIDTGVLINKKLKT